MPRFLTTSRTRLIALPAVLAISALGIFGAAQSASASVQAPIGLGTADSYNVLAASTVTNTGPSVINNGDVGLSPGTSVTGFPPAVIANGVIHATDAQAQLAQTDLTTAYNDAAGRTPDASGIVDLASQVLTPGVYSGDALALNGTVTLNGGPTDVFIFQAASTLITGSSSTVALTGGATSCNVFWQVGSSATLGSASVFAGTILAQTSITATTGATVEGRLLARTGAVTLDSNVITRPASCAARSAIEASTQTSEQLAAAALAATAAADAAAAQAAIDLAAAQAAAAATATPAPVVTPTATRTPRATATPTATAVADNSSSNSDDNDLTTITNLADTGLDVTPYAILAGGLSVAGVLFITLGQLRRRRSPVASAVLKDED